MIKQTKKLFFKLLEEELTAVLAILILGVGALFVHAGNITTVTLTVYPTGGSITVTAPDGGESWTVGSSQNITWTTLGSITDVKIELQRTTGGSWETIIASTTNDGSYPWTVTSPTTSTAKVKISKVGDDAIYDESNSTFTIASAGGGGGGIFLPQPGINDVTPHIIVNSGETEIAIVGINFKSTVSFQLDGIPLKNTRWVSSTQAYATVPVLPTGTYRLWVYNGDGTYNYWGTLIQVVSQQYESVTSRPELNLYMQPGERKLVEIDFTNTGNSVWNQLLKLGTTDPQDRNSVFHDPISWLSPNRAASYSGKSLAYGGKATLSFHLKAPDKIGKYTEKFALLLEGQKWLTMSSVVINILVTSKEEPLPSTGGELYYSAKWVKQSPYLTLKPGQTAEMWVEFKNTGSLPWYNTGVNPVRLGTSNPWDRESIFSNGNWISKNRPVIVNGLTVAKTDGHIVNPGEIGRFTFKITAPTKLGKYREYFRPVVEYKEWLPDYGVYWDLVVKGEAVKTALSTGGEPTAKEPLIKQILPSAPGESKDVTEGFLRNFGQTISRLFSDIRNLFSGWF